ncbi:MAG: BRCT domain-containing protein [Thiotrichaceae bacterium]|nr:BRCT domain-containing protein [Thiotrichaceae bacterium]
MNLTLADIQRAWELKDPDLVNYIIALAQQEDPDPEKPIRAEALTFNRFLRVILSWEFRQLSYEEQRDYRIEQLRLLEADDAEVPLAERLKLHTIILLLWTDTSHYARSVLVEIIRQVPLVYGTWRAFKHIYKASELTNNYQLLAEISARCDSRRSNNISYATMLYMRRRAWRYLRRLGETLPVCYPDAAAYFLAAYPSSVNWQNTWVANHIFYHEQQGYSSKSFGYIPNSNKLLAHRAFAETWQRSPEPLLRLLGMARSEKVRQYASDALKSDFKVMLREVEPSWIISLASLPEQSQSIDHFIIWLLKNSPKLEQHQFHQNGLHDVVISLLDSNHLSAQEYATAYVKSHARDLPLSIIRRLIPNKKLVALIQLLLAERHPRNDVGLELWNILLSHQHHNKFASNAILEHFGRKELTPEWFEQHLLHSTHDSLQFVKKYLLTFHSSKDLGINYFLSIAEQLNTSKNRDVIAFLTTQLEKFDLSKLSIDSMQEALLNPLLSQFMIDAIENSKVKASNLPLAYYQALVYEPDWKDNEFINQLKQSDKNWAKDLEFNEDLAATVRDWLSDVRRFSPADLGFEWLMTLINSTIMEYHTFAKDVLISAFLPADFAEKDEIEAPVESAGNIDKTVDLEEKTYLFTGKLKTMTRKEAQVIVSAANGKNHKAVNGKLDFLVIGDEGSPMYGNGRKGSKQVKAETLIEKGAELKVISETAFLQKMAGEEREFSTDSVNEGCQNLWAMAVDKPDTPVSKFAIQYIRHHHPDICLKLTDRPVDPGAEIPESFATFEQFKPFFYHQHKPLRQLALDFAHYEFTAWQVPSSELIALCESKYTEVRDFVSKALLAKPKAKNKRYLIDASLLEASAVYSFCESKKPETRQLGMKIIQKHEKFQLPESLFQLTESPDRELRAFVVRILWSLYRRYSTTRHWQPRLSVMATQRKKDKEKQREAEQNLGCGLPKRPDNLPADSDALQQLLRRWLYELPPGRLAADRINTGLKPLSASRAKKALIETFRDIALEDESFATMVLPLFENFTQSRGLMEQAACLVAVTRIQYSYPDLVAGAT